LEFGAQCRRGHFAIPLDRAFQNSQKFPAAEDGTLLNRSVNLAFFDSPLEVPTDATIPTLITKDNVDDPILWAKDQVIDRSALERKS